ncbi:MAG: type I-U CRISPR-associated RAMP protein Csb1/Cas7u [Deltaproteobacteria bacterium]|nr:type I-U CRISPR-associated RAMP protein Csb1/Cas7u [Deltaproteobacteria bacterium]
MSETKTLTLDDLKQALAGHAAAFRCITEYQPAGGDGDKVFPPTYAGGKYAVEKRVIGGKTVDCVLLNSVQSEANHMELALRDAWEDMSSGKRRIELPMVKTRFDLNIKGVSKVIGVTSLDAPHRIADAIFRDSYREENGEKVMFRKSEKGKILDAADVRNATELFGLCPTALLFGLWDAAGPRGGLGAKFQRAIVSEIVGIGAQPGVTTGGKVDHLNILKDAGVLYERAMKSDALPGWTLDENLAAKRDDKAVKVGKKGDGRPSDVNLGGVTPDFAYTRDSQGKKIFEDAKDENGNSVFSRDKRGDPRIKGGFTIEKAVQTTVLSLTALRRLRFPPLHGKQDGQSTAEQAARTVLAALGLCAAALVREQGVDLRSRCQLCPTGPFVWELLNEPGEKEHSRFTLSADDAVGIFNQAVKEAQMENVGLPWEKTVIDLIPSDDLLALVQRSQEIGPDDSEGEE